MSDAASPKVSVVMAAYNDLRFLDPAVESVINQTFDDLELVLVDDHTGQGDIFVHQAARDPRIRILTNDANLGAMEAANRGIRVARGDIIARTQATAAASVSLSQITRLRPLRLAA
jgi:glycosyltransferase involved in cell wall biosynthesis